MLTPKEEKTSPLSRAVAVEERPNLLLPPSPSSPLTAPMAARPPATILAKPNLTTLSRMRVLLLFLLYVQCSSCSIPFVNSVVARYRARADHALRTPSLSYQQSQSIANAMSDSSTSTYCPPAVAGCLAALSRVERERGSSSLSAFLGIWKQNCRRPSLSPCCRYISVCVPGSCGC